MLTYTGQQTYVQDLASDSNSTNLVLFKNLINVGLHKIERKLDIFVTEKEDTFTTVTDALADGSYQLPRGFVSLNDLYVTVGTTQYHIEHLIEDPAWWGQLVGSTTQSTSDFVRYARVKGRKLYLWPTPSTAYTATISYFGTSKDLSQEDYTEGGVLTLANGGVAVTGTGTTFTAQMVGRVFQVNADAEWHYIKAYTSATAIELETPYQGIAIAAGNAPYKIGEVCNLPEDIHDLPCIWTLWQFFAFYHRDKFLASMYEKMYRDGLGDAMMEYSSAGSGVIITGRTDATNGVINPNFYPLNMT